VCKAGHRKMGHTNGKINHDTSKNGTQPSPLRNNSLTVYNICELACIFGLIGPNKQIFFTSKPQNVAPCWNGVLPLGYTRRRMLERVCKVPQGKAPQLGKMKKKGVTGSRTNQGFQTNKPNNKLKTTMLPFKLKNCLHGAPGLGAWR